jgi:hypothetical protein
MIFWYVYMMIDINNVTTDTKAATQASRCPGHLNKSSLYYYFRIAFGFWKFGMKLISNLSPKIYLEINKERILRLEDREVRV